MISSLWLRQAFKTASSAAATILLPWSTILVLFLFASVRTTLPVEHCAAGNQSNTPLRRAQAQASPEAVPDGLTASDWSSIRQQVEQHRHRAVAVDGGYRARNPGQQWLTRFDGRGFLTRPNSGAWRWGLELQSYGFAGHERALAMPPRVSTAGSRVTYRWDAVLQEWFVNDQRGLEHGFTLLERPLLNEPPSRQGNAAQTSAHESSQSPPTSATSSLNTQPSTLNLLLRVRGGLRPEVEASGRGVRFVDAHGTVALTYAGLSARDADGRDIPARFELLPARAGYPHSAAKSATLALAACREGDCEPCQESELRLVIDEHGARYPLIIDPVAQQAYLKASNTGAGGVASAIRSPCQATRSWSGRPTKTARPPG